MNLGLINKSPIYPKLWEKAELLTVNCVARGVTYWATCGIRTFDESAEIYSWGRTKQNPYVAATPDKPLGPVASNAKAGQSFHNYGLAMDFRRDANPSKPGLQERWKKGDFQVLAEEAVKLGLEPGLFWTNFVDEPHIQLHIGKHGLKLANLQAEYNKGGVPAVWAMLDRYAW